ncbi:TadE/TadG family type IV pilus assembly protein [Kitasatospora sp. NPDC001540]|uniref:TadE/TadG family type IV pilus assembly protein n=1 Tax=Kitasatospora sp. NPDC001540 TaxID=3364014 RepID=UPI0036B6FD5A
MELVFIAPVLVLMALLLVGLGQIVEAKSSLDGAARDAARAGALQRDYGSAVAAATETATAGAARVCSGGQVRVETGGRWESGGVFTVTLSCTVHGLRMTGLPVTTPARSTSSAPLDVYRRVS